MNHKTKGFLSPDDKEMEELFGALTTDISSTLTQIGVKAISYEGFKTGIELMMNKSYNQGCKQTTDKALSIVEETFK